MADIAANAILSNAEMGAADRATIESGTFSGRVLMENAGAAVADAAMARLAGARRVHVLCGPGNNGGDGYVAARRLAERGVPVRLYALAPVRPGTDAQIAARRWTGPVDPLGDLAPAAGDLAIDALFGAGFSGALPERAAAALDRCRAAGCPVLAVDLPSGVNGDTGQGPGAVAAAATVTFYRKKPGPLLYPGRALCGDIAVADIGVRADATPATVENMPASWAHRLPRPAAETHKYARGAVAVFSGPRHGTGASRLAAMAAQRAGAGAVTILGAPDALDIHAAHVTSIMLRPAGGDPLEALAALKGVRAVILGPGLDDPERARAVAPGMLERTGALLVLDADGITAFADDPSPLFEAAGRMPGARLVLTPHEGEFARLFPDLARSGGGKLEKARRAAARSGAIMLYKGPDTVIVAPDGRAAINANATAALATAGSGDVLAGIIAGLAGQSMPAFEAACAAAWLHAEAGKRAGPHAVAEDLVSALAPVLSGVADPG